jgi:hypothetical protein
MSRGRLIAVLTAALLLAGACASSDGDAARGDATDGDSEVAAAAEPTEQALTESGAAEDFSTPLLDEERRADVPDTPSDYVLVYHGDSVASSVREQVETYLDWGLRINMVDHSFPGTAACVAREQFIADSQSGAWGAVLLFSNNVFPDCMHDDAGEPLEGEALWEKFVADMEFAVATLVDGGVRVYLPTLPIARHQVETPEDTERLNALLADLADSHELATLVDAAPAVLTPAGEYAEYLPCFRYEPCLNGTTDDGTGVNLVREVDGGHFCTGGFYDYSELEGECPAWPSGAVRYGLAISQPIIEDAYEEFTGAG